MKSTPIKRIVNYFNEWNRERAIVLGTSLVILMYLGSFPVQYFFESLDENDRVIKQRTEEYGQLARAAVRYSTLQDKLAEIEKTYKQSQMTFEQVSVELDRIVKETIGSSTYTLNKIRTPTKLGFDYDKQEFMLKIDSLNLDQLVKLLHRLETGERPLFLGKVDLTKPASGAAFNVNLEIFSIRKSAA